MSMASKAFKKIVIEQENDEQRHQSGEAMLEEVVSQDEEKVDEEKNQQNLFASVYEVGLNKGLHLSQILSQNGEKVVIYTNHVIFRYHGKTKMYCKTSLYILSGNNIIRRTAVWITEWKVFENFILCVIFLNSVTLALYDYKDRDSLTYYNQQVELAGKVFTICFAVEAILEIMARGFVLHKKSYLRTGWGVLDFIVVVSGLVEFFTSSVKLKALRVLRMLRPLRSITQFASLRKLVSALIQSLPDFVHVVIFLIYVLVLFAILGTHLYNGVFYNACRFNKTPETHDSWEIDTSHQRVCSKSGQGTFTCPGTEYCGNPEEFDISLENDKVINNQYMYYGIHNFDNMLNSLLVVFQIVTAESWTTYMYNLMDVESPLMAGLFTIMLVMFGSFFLMNLILAVIIQAFINITQDELEKESEKLIKIIESKEKEAENQVKQLEQDDNQKSFIEDDSNSDIIQKQSNKMMQSQSITQSYGTNKNGNRTPEIGMVAMNATSHDYFESPLQKSEKMPIEKRGLQDSPDLEMEFQNSISRSANIKNSQSGQKLLKHKTLKQDMNFMKDHVLTNKVLAIFQKGKNLKRPPLRARMLKDADGNDLRVVVSDPSLESVHNTDPENKTNQNQLAEPNNEETNKIANPLGKAFTLYIEKNMDQEPDQKDLNLNEVLSIMKECYLDQKKDLENEKTIRSLTVLKVKIDMTMRALNIGNHIVKQMRKHSIITRSKKNPIFEYFYNIVKSKQFLWVVSMAIIGNTVTLGFDKYPEDYGQTELIEKINIGFQLFFIMECVMKLIGLGIRGYFYDSYNVFDIILVLGSIVDLFLSQILGQKRKGVIAALRGFRLIRVFKLAKQWKRLDILLKTIKRTLKDVSIFSILLFLFMFTFALLGMELFANKAKFTSDNSLNLVHGESPDNNFDNLLNAFTTVFVVMTADGWSGIYFDHYRAMSSIVTTSYFILMIIIGQKMLLNLFLAILLQNFDEDAMKQQEFQIQQADLKHKDALLKTFEIFRDTSTSCFNDILSFFVRDRTNQTMPETKMIEASNSLQISDKKLDISKEESDRLNKSLGNNLQMQQNETDEQWKKLQEKSEQQNFQLQGKSLNMFLTTNPIRKFIYNLVTNQKLDQLMVIVILVSSVQLALDSPINDPNGAVAYYLYMVDVITTCLFATECILKVIAFGFVFNGKYSYLKSTWNIIDFGIILFSVVSLTPISKNFRIFKMFRILRILRLISRNESLKVGVQSLFFAFPNIIKVVIIILFFFLIFGVLTVGFFKGKFYYCENEHSIVTILESRGLSDLITDYTYIPKYRFLQDETGIIEQIPQKDDSIPSEVVTPTNENIEEVITVIDDVQYFKNLHQVKEIEISDKWICISSGGEWLNRANNFDNFYQAMGTLFIMSTASAWADIMYTCAATTEPDYAHVRMNNPFWIVFFVFFIIVASFFLLNLFVGVVISTFNSEQDKASGNNMLTDKQKEWIHTRLLVLRSTPIHRPIVPQNPIRAYFFKIQEHPWYEHFIFACIVLNTVVLALKWYRQPANLEMIAEYINYGFTAIFLMEAIIKMTALGFYKYFKQSWNIFDFIVIVGSLVSIILSLASSISIKGAVTIARALRILRVARLIKRAKSLHLLFNTFVITLPGMINIGGLLLILIYFYSILGMQLFGQVKRVGAFDDTLNFENFTNAFCALFAVATGDGWSDIMHSTIKKRSILNQCLSYPSFDDYVENHYQTIGCGTGFEGIIFFFSFFLLVNLIFLNLFIAVILQGFQDTQQKEKRYLNEDMLVRFREAWAEFDPDATSFIKISKLRMFLVKLGDPLGFKGRYMKNSELQDKFIALLKLPIYENFTCYQFLDVLDALSLRSMVLDQIKKQNKQHANEDELDEEDKKVIRDIEHNDSFRSDEDFDNEMQIEKHENTVKTQIQQDINKLLLKDEASFIDAVKEVKFREKKSIHLENKKDGAMTSLHQSIAEVAVKRMKNFLLIQRLQKIQNLGSPNNNITGNPWKAEATKSLKVSEYSDSPTMSIDMREGCSNETVLQRKSTDVKRKSSPIMIKKADTVDYSEVIDDTFTYSIKPIPCSLQSSDRDVGNKNTKKAQDWQMKKQIIQTKRQRAMNKIIIVEDEEMSTEQAPQIQPNNENLFQRQSNKVKKNQGGGTGESIFLQNCEDEL